MQYIHRPYSNSECHIGLVERLKTNLELATTAIHLFQGPPPSEYNFWNAGHIAHSGPYVDFLSKLFTRAPTRPVESRWCRGNTLILLITPLPMYPGNHLSILSVCFKCTLLKLAPGKIWECGHSESQGLFFAPFHMSHTNCVV